MVSTDMHFDVAPNTNYRLMIRQMYTVRERALVPFELSNYLSVRFIF
jgi:hypothetical protein